MQNSKPLVILITGTSKGIGNYLAKYYASKGHIVFGCSRSPFIEEIANYQHFQVDVTNEVDVKTIFKTIRKQHKRLDVLINNAAINPAITPSIFLTKKVMMAAFEVNVYAPMQFCREAIKVMARNSFGRIINIGSMAAKLEVKGEALYTSTKAALNSYTRVLAKETYELGITANIVAPSAIKTDLSAQINQEALQAVLKQNTVPEYGKMEDVSSIIDTLIEESSSAITGQMIYLGGV